MSAKPKTSDDSARWQSISFADESADSMSDACTIATVTGEPPVDNFDLDAAVATFEGEGNVLRLFCDEASPV